MANKQKLIKTQIAKSWRTEFPFLKPVDLEEIPHVSKGCNFLCAAYGEARSRYYFVRLGFSDKTRGQFTIGITVSPTPQKSILEHSLGAQTLGPASIGMFGIWKFLKRPRYDWALVDFAAEQKALFAKLGAPLIDFQAHHQSPNVWRPSTYDQPFEKILGEAIADVNAKLRNDVFPVLQISRTILEK